MTGPAEHRQARARLLEREDAALDEQRSRLAGDQVVDLIVSIEARQRFPLDRQRHHTCELGH